MLSEFIFWYLTVAVFGLMVGSFLNVVILRFDDLKTVVALPSHCPRCRKNLKWYELIPLLSYLVLFGRCRGCKEKISVQYPLVEAGTAIIFTLLFWKFGLSWSFGLFVFLSCILIVIFIYDLIHSLIADWLVWLAIGIWLVYLIVNYLLSSQLSVLSSFLLGGFALGGFLGFLVLASKEQWMGIGDIKLGFLLGALVGWPSVLVLTFLAFILGSIVGLILIFGRKKSMKDQVPFAPFLITALWITLFWGTNLISWYINSLF